MHNYKLQDVIMHIDYISIYYIYNEINMKAILYILLDKIMR